MNRSAYKYTFKLLALGIGATSTDKNEMEKDEAFIAEGISYTVYNSATGAVINDPYVLVNFKPKASEADLISQPTPLPAVAGSGENPHIISMPWKFAGNTSPHMEAKNQTGVAVDIYVTLHGYLESDRQALSV